MISRLSALAPVLLCAMARGQETIGHVALQDAMLTGSLEVSGGDATLRGGASIIAKDHTAVLALNRGGSVSVCSTSSLHVTSGAGSQAPLLFALDRGAIEIRGLIEQRDALITPDLRMSAKASGRLDLRVRVVSNGDTCVENRGEGAPVIEVVEQFGDGVYQIGGGQHVLFEHGSIREVVDRESSPCGCPPTPVMSLAEKGVTVAPGQAARAGSEAAQRREEHPFPAAESQGLAATGAAKVPQAPQGQVHAQVAATMAYAGDAESSSGGAGRADSTSAATKPGGGAPSAAGSGATAATDVAPARPAVAAPTESEPVKVESPAAPAPPGARDIGHRIGRFFKRLFGGR